MLFQKHWFRAKIDEVFCWKITFLLKKTNMVGTVSIAIAERAPTKLERKCDYHVWNKELRTKVNKQRNKAT